MEPAYFCKCKHSRGYHINADTWMQLRIGGCEACDCKKYYSVDSNIIRTKSDIFLVGLFLTIIFTVEFAFIIQLDLFPQSGTGDEWPERFVNIMVTIAVSIGWVIGFTFMYSVATHNLFGQKQRRTVKVTMT